MGGTLLDMCLDMFSNVVFCAMVTTLILGGIAKSISKKAKKIERQERAKELSNFLGKLAWAWFSLGVGTLVMQIVQALKMIE